MCIKRFGIGGSSLENPGQPEVADIAHPAYIRFVQSSS